jgi:death-on-curing family protein
MTTLNGSVESVLAQASRYDGFYNKAASVIRGIAGNHLFDNGNKRTANAVYDLLRSRNGITTGASSAEVRRIINDVATGVRTEIDDIARALRGF